MRIVQRGSSPDILIAYLVGPHLDADLRRVLGPSPWIVTFGDAQGRSPVEVTQALALDRVRSCVLVGYSQGMMAVRSALRSGSIPVADRFGVVAIDGTHASTPPEDWQIRTWQNLAEQARRGERLFVARCTAQTYVEHLPSGRFLSTLTVLRKAIDETLEPGAELHDGDLHVHAYPSKTIDKDAHIAQQRAVLPEMLERHARPWLERCC